MLKRPNEPQFKVCFKLLIYKDVLEGRTGSLLGGRLQSTDK